MSLRRVRVGETVMITATAMYNKLNRIACSILWATRRQYSIVHCISKGHSSGCINSLSYAPFNNLSSRTVGLQTYREADIVHVLTCCPRRYCTTTSHRQLPVLTLYTKQPCPLCDQALHQLKPFLDQVSLEKVDITAPENKIWWNAYRYDIPVFHLNGKFLMKHKADLDRLRIALKDFHRDNNP